MMKSTVGCGVTPCILARARPCCSRLATAGTDVMVFNEQRPPPCTAPPSPSRAAAIRAWRPGHRTPPPTCRQPAVSAARLGGASLRAAVAAPVPIKATSLPAQAQPVSPPRQPVVCVPEVVEVQHRALVRETAPAAEVSHTGRPPSWQLSG